MIGTNVFERESRLINSENEFYNEKLESKSRASSKSMSMKHELLDKLFDADTTKNIEAVGKSLIKSIDDDTIVTNNEDSSIKIQNKYLFKKLDKLQRENERYTVISLRAF